MLKNIFNWNSIVSKLLVAIYLWVFCGVLIVGITLNISWKMEDRGTAINDAGSLRKRVYYITALFLHEEKKQSLEKEIDDYQALLKKLKKQGDEETQHQAERIEVEFNKLLDKLYTATPEERGSLTILQLATHLTQEIDDFVKIIENKNTLNIQIFRAIQFILIVLIIFSAFLSFILLRRLVLQPLWKIKYGIEEVTTGKLQTRVNLISKDEFQDVADGFNQMASSLEDVYNNLEKKVSEKTLELEKKNQNWSMLYNITAYLHEKTPTPDVIYYFVEQIMFLVDACSGSLKFTEKNARNLGVILENNTVSIHFKERCRQHMDDCNTIVFFPHYLNYEESRIEHDVFCHKNDDSQLVNFSIKHSGKVLGVLSLLLNDKNKFTENDFMLVDLLCTQLAISIENIQFVNQEKQLAVLEERNLMAQGLHDSIAQSLSFLNLQVQMLINAHQENNQQKIEQNIKFIQQGVQQCYEDVRELLSNFRLKLTAVDFISKINAVISRYQSNIKTNIHLNTQTQNIHLLPEQQLQVVFILQEALSNIRKHAQATDVYVTISSGSEFLLTVKDNGIGFDTRISKEQTGNHIGLRIMHERANKINAQISIESHIGLGTQIILRIPL